MSCCHMSSAFVDHCLWLFFYAVISCFYMSSAYVDHCDMLNNVCFHVYAQKSLFMIVCHAVMSCCQVVICQVFMLITGTCWTSFVFMSMLKSHFKIVCHAVMSWCHNVMMAWCRMSYVKCLMLILGTCWTSFVFMCRLKSDCLSSCHVILAGCRCHAVICQMVNVDPWDILNNFCFHVQARS